MELVDTRDLKSLDRNIVPVQVRPRVPIIMSNNWLVATYKINEVKRVEANLLNQKFEYYLPKITFKGINSVSKEEVLFPGYIFVNTGLANYSALKYTMGIKDIIKFGYNIPRFSSEDIKIMQKAEKKSKIEPISMQLKIGQEVTIAKGSFRGTVAKVSKLPSKDRVGIFISFLGTMRCITIPEKDLVI